MVIQGGATSELVLSSTSLSGRARSTMASMLHRQFPLPEGGMGLFRHQHRPTERQHALAALVDGPGLDAHDAAIALLRLAFVEDARVGVECVAVEGGMV